MIESYTFGRMSIDGKLYHKDVIILLDGRVISPWWRQAGHQLFLSDLTAVIDNAPEIIVIGTGDPGMMKPHRGLEEELKGMGIQAVVLPTQKAVRAYNAFKEQGEAVAACFHLTC
ncbi:MAG: hypothetical protein D3926_19470 [Desulfobacteraceae bacterium]|nr:MAG: hypothetical protein D3926_19470 [Desulfobacteraceae bacterium]